MYYSFMSSCTLLRGIYEELMDMAEIGFNYSYIAYNNFFIYNYRQSLRSRTWRVGGPCLGHAPRQPRYLTGSAPPDPLASLESIISCVCRDQEAGHGWDVRRR